MKARTSDIQLSSFVLLLAAALVGIWMFVDHPQPGPSKHPTAIAAPPPLSNDAVGPPRILFVANQGQAPSNVRFHAAAAGHTTLLNDDGLLLYRSPRDGRPESSVAIRFVGAATPSSIEGLEKQDASVHFYAGSDPEEWQTHTPTFARVRYESLYPSIDLYYFGDGSRLKSEFHVAPRGNPGLIRFVYDGARKVELTEDGSLRITTGEGILTEGAPLVYQYRDTGERIAVESKYLIREDDTSAGLMTGSTIGFAIGSYDRDLPLVIDPELVFETTFGGSDQDTPTGIAYTPDGLIVVVGHTLSNDFPTVNPFQGTRGASGEDIFVTVIDPATDEIVYSTYIGGDTPVPGFTNAPDWAAGVTVDDDGNIFVVGHSAATDFPMMNAIQETNQGKWDVIVMRFNPDGTLAFSTYVGGNGFDQAGDIALLSDGIAITGSSDFGPTFPQVNPIQPPGGFDDVFITILEELPGDPLSYVVAFSTAIGGSLNDRGVGIAVDSSDHIYVGGQTVSSDFPTVNPWQPNIAGNWDGFVAKMKMRSDTTEVLFATFYGGKEFENVADLAVTDDGGVVLVGSTNSSDLPTMNPVQPSMAGVQDAFVALFDEGGSLAFASYWGGSDWDAGNAVSFKAGSILFGGTTFSIDFPELNPLPNAPNQPNGFMSGVKLFGDQLPAFKRIVDNVAPEVNFSSTVKGFVAAQAADPGGNQTAYASEKLGEVILGVIASDSPIKAELIISVLASESRVELGDTFHVTISVTNTGAVDALSVKVRDIVARLFLSYINTDDGCVGELDEDDDTVLTCDIGTLPPESTVTFRPVFRVSNVEIVFPLFFEPFARGINTNTARQTTSIELEPFIGTAIIAYWAIAGYSNRPLPKSATSAVDVLDVYIDSVLVAEGLQVQSSTGATPMTLLRLEPQVDLIDAGSADNSNLVHSFVANFLVGDGVDAFLSPQNALVFLQIDEDSLEMHVKHEFRSVADDPTRVEFFFANAAVDIDAIDLRLGDGSTLFEQVEPRDLTDYSSVSASVQEFAVTASDGLELNSFEIDLTGFLGQAFTFIAVPTDPASNPMDPLEVLVFDAAGNRIQTVATASEEASVPVRSFELKPNYPNPFSGRTTLHFSMSEAAAISVEVFDVLGRSVKRRSAGVQAPGENVTMSLDLSNLPAGEYLYRLVATGRTQTYRRSGRLLNLP